MTRYASNYDIGDLVRVTGTWTDPYNSNAAVDPAVVKFSVRNPAGTVTTSTYGTGIAIVRSAAGVYYMDVDLSSAGRWYVRVWSTGTGQAAEERILVADTHAAV
jgi:hypothetical protein